MITDRQEKILKALARYKYLTASQILDLKICGLSTARQYLFVLQNLKLINKTIYSQAITENYKTKNIRLEGLNFLSKSGVKLLKDEFEIENIKHPKSFKTSFSNDYFHRIFIVSVLISFDLWLNETKKDGFFLVDFHNSETTIKINSNLTVKPDIILNFNNSFYIIEIWAGLEKEYILNQLAKLLEALASKKINEFLEYDRIPRILNVFKDFGTMEKIKQSLKNDVIFKNAIEKGLFYFATLDEIKQDFQYWTNSNDLKIDIDKF